MRSPRRDPAPIDRSVKALIRRFPAVFFRLARAEADPASITAGDVPVNLPEHRADQVFLVGAEGDARRWGLHLEYQIQPDRRVQAGWQFKNASLNRQLGIPVLLVVLYLTRGGRSRFPAEHIL